MNTHADHFVGAAIDDTDNAQAQVEEMIRHNFLMDQVSIQHKTGGEGDDFLGIAYTNERERFKVWGAKGALWGSLGGLLLTAKGLSASLGLTMSFSEALINRDPAKAIRELASAGTTLHLAASPGAAARTLQLIDATMKAKVDEGDSKTLAWFPLLHASLLTLLNDATEGAADNLIGQAESMLQGDIEGDPITPLMAARPMLACDGLDIPLHNAIKAQGKLMEQFGQKTEDSDYDSIQNSLRSALAYGLGSHGN
jgi:hypothetical protein